MTLKFNVMAKQIELEHYMKQHQEEYLLAKTCYMTNAVFYEREKLN